MDTKKLHRLFYNKYDTSVWLNENLEEAQKDEIKWYYCGAQKDFKKDFVQQTIDEYFNENELYLIITSGNSSLVSTGKIPEEISKFINKKQIGIMNKSLDKIMFFQETVFKKGVIKEYPKSRPKPADVPLKVEFHANMYEHSTQRISDALDAPFEKLEEKLNKDYQGCMEYLWIDVELISHYSALPFRFQKRVNIASGVGGKDYYYNVGNYSILPDFEKLKTLSEELAVEYILTLIYNSTEILIKKKKRLDNFNAEKFRLDFKNACLELGYSIKTE